MLNALIDLFFPKICYACGHSIESKLKHICISCRHHLPRVINSSNKENSIEKIFWGRLPLEKATAFVQFQKGGIVQNLMHHFKYKGIKEIGITLGELTAHETKKTSFFENIDLIIPIPIHKLKEKKRGYNQSDFIAEGVSNITGIEVNKTAVKKTINTSSQTRKSRFKRWENVKTTFDILTPLQIENKHILLVDDVVTTGATIEALGTELLKLNGVKLSLLTIASTF